ncbi:MAG TPA: hypothetical protein VGC36_04855, partial [Rhizomicrobium sp.]
VAGCDVELPLPEPHRDHGKSDDFAWAQARMSLFQTFMATNNNGARTAPTICRTVIEAYGEITTASDCVPAGAGFRIRVPFATPMEPAG